MWNCYEVQMATHPEDGARATGRDSERGLECAEVDVLAQILLTVDNALEVGTSHGQRRNYVELCVRS